MSDIDFQNGFIVGLATRGLTTGTPSIKLINVQNNYGGVSFTWILLTINQDIATFDPLLNLEAFRVIGYKDWVLKVYNIYEIVRVNSSQIALRTDDFEEIDLSLELHYLSAVGTLKTLSGLPINDLAGIFPITFVKPKVKARESILYRDVSTGRTTSVSASIQLINDVVTQGSEYISFLDVSSLGAFSMSVTISVL